jgi:hypothetical protein
VHAHGDALSIAIEGTVDAVVKQAARYTIVNIETREPSLEDLFLAYFRADGHPPETGEAS